MPSGNPAGDIEKIERRKLFIFIALFFPLFLNRGKIRMLFVILLLRKPPLQHRSWNDGRRNMVKKLRLLVLFSMDGGIEKSYVLVLEIVSKLRPV
jgi:hypothetical protein